MKRHPVIVIFLTLFVIGGLFVAFAIMVMIGEWTLQAAWAFLSGWFTYPSRIFPKITYNIEMILCGIGALAMALFFGHRFLCWLAEQVPSLPSPWKFRTTAILSFLLLSMFGTSIAMTGIIHQAAWLGSAPSITRVRGISISTMQHRDASRLLNFLIFPTGENSQDGILPKSLVAPRPQEYSDFHSIPLLCPYGKNESEPWLYPGAGKELFKGGRFPVLISPRPNREGQIIVAYSNLMTESYPFDQLPSEIAKFFR